MSHAHQLGVFYGNFKPETENGQLKTLTLNTNALNIVWGGGNNRYWKKITEEPPIVELIGVYWLEVSAKIPLSFFPPGKYRVYFNIKLKSDATGWDSYPVHFKLRLPGQRSMQYSLNLSEYKSSDKVEKWQKIPANGISFEVSYDSTTKYPNSMLTFVMYEIECESYKTGLQIKEVIILAE